MSHVFFAVSRVGPLLGFGTLNQSRVPLLDCVPVLKFLPPLPSGLRGQMAPPPQITGSTPSPGPPRLSPCVPAFGLQQVVGGSVKFKMEKSFHVQRGWGVCLV